jgi:hypothetical protein
MEQVSAVEWLVDALMINDEAPNYNQWAIDKAKQMEKEQLEKIKDFDTWKEWKNS